jgi:hypothetical protein
MAAASHPCASAASEQALVDSELTEFGFVELRAKLQAENDDLRAKVVSLALEMQSLRSNRQR